MKVVQKLNGLKDTVLITEHSKNMYQMYSFVFFIGDVHMNDIF
jgi:hypothetical protein